MVAGTGKSEMVTGVKLQKFDKKQTVDLTKLDLADFEVIIASLDEYEQYIIRVLTEEMRALTVKDLQRGMLYFMKRKEYNENEWDSKGKRHYKNFYDVEMNPPSYYLIRTRLKYLEDRGFITRKKPIDNKNIVEYIILTPSFYKIWKYGRNLVHPDKIIRDSEGISEVQRVNKRIKEFFGK